MPGGFTLVPRYCNGRAYGTNNTSFGYGGTAVTPSTTANTKGSWTQVISATVGEISELWVFLEGQAGTAIAVEGVDIGIGASGSEQVLLPNLIWCPCGQFNSGTSIYRLPIFIPNGTRISARSQANIASAGNSLNVSVRGFAGGFEAPLINGADAIGFNTATSFGTTVTPGNATKGSYAQLTSSTARDYCGLYVAIDGQSANNTDFWNVDIAVGGSGSEQVVVPDLPVQLTRNNATFGPFFVPVAAGTRLSARAADTGGGTAALGVTVHGLYP